MLLILVIYYLVSLSSSLREAVSDLRTQLRQERDTGRRNHRRSQDAVNTTAPRETDAGLIAGKIIAQWRSKAVPPLNPKITAKVQETQTNFAKNAAAVVANKRSADKSTGFHFKSNLVVNQADFLKFIKFKLNDRLWILINC